MNFKRTISLFAVLFLWINADAKPSGAAFIKDAAAAYADLSTVSSFQFLKNRETAGLLISGLRIEKVNQFRSKFRTPSSTQLAAPVFFVLSSEFTPLTASRQGNFDHLPPPFYYIFLFRQALF